MRELLWEQLQHELQDGNFCVAISFDIGCAGMLNTVYNYSIQINGDEIEIAEDDFIFNLNLEDCGIAYQEEDDMYIFSNEQYIFSVSIIR